MLWRLCCQLCEKFGSGIMICWLSGEPSNPREPEGRRTCLRLHTAIAYTDETESVHVGLFFDQAASANTATTSLIPLSPSSACSAALARRLRPSIRRSLEVDESMHSASLSAVHFSSWPNSVASPPPTLSAKTQQLREERLGYSWLTTRGPHYKSPKLDVEIPFWHRQPLLQIRRLVFCKAFFFTPSTV